MFDCSDQERVVVDLVVLVDELRFEKGCFSEACTLMCDQPIPPVPLVLTYNALHIAHV